MKPRSLFVVLGLGVLATYGACRALHHDDDIAANASLLPDRLWLESMPEKRTDYVHGLYVVGGQDAGVFSRSSNFDLHLEIFELDEKKEELGFTFPQSGKKAKVKFSIRSCSDKKGFDLCLDLAENPWSGPKRYYASRDQDSLGDVAREMQGELAREVHR